MNFPEDMWVIAAEMRPGNPKVVHHARANLRPPTSSYMKDAIPGVAYENGDKALGRSDGSIDLLGKFNPGLGEQGFSEFDSAKFVPKGSDIVFNLHYTAAGTETDGPSKVGLVFAKPGWKPKYRYFVHNGPPANNLAIPPSDSNAEVVSGVDVAAADEAGVHAAAHASAGQGLRDAPHLPVGRDAHGAQGQVGFQLAPRVRPCRADRSSGRHAHRQHLSLRQLAGQQGESGSEQARCIWGDQNWDEMQNIFIGVLVDPSLDQRTFFKASGPSLLPRGDSGPTLSTMLAPPGAQASSRPSNEAP